MHNKYTTVVQNWVINDQVKYHGCLRIQFDSKYNKNPIITGILFSVSRHKETNKVYKQNSQLQCNKHC